MGGYPCDGAEHCRLLNANFFYVKALKDVPAKILLGLKDTTLAAWYGVELAKVGKDDILRVWGCGAVGLSI